MKAILKTESPKSVCQIVNGDKSIIISRVKPNCDLPIDVYLGCSKQGSNKDYFLVDSKSFYEDFLRQPMQSRFSILPKNYNYDFFGSVVNSKVVAKFTLNKCEKLKWNDNGYGLLYEKEIIKTSCMEEKELYHYLQGTGYAWHIEDLVIFDTPKELTEFRKALSPKEINDLYELDLPTYKMLTKAPQSYCYIEVEE